MGKYLKLGKWDIKIGKVGRQRAAHSKIKNNSVY